MILTEKSNTVASTRREDAVEIQLRAQPGTGFSWVPKESTAAVTPLEPIRGEALPGGWQTQRFRFLAPRAGTYRVSFSYDQPWMGGIKGARVMRFTINVR